MKGTTRRAVMASGAALALLVSGTGMAQAAAKPAPARYRLTVKTDLRAAEKPTLHNSRAAEANSRLAGIPGDPPGFCTDIPNPMTNAFLRTHLCERGLVTVSVWSPEKVLVGQARFHTYHETSLELRSTTWTEKVTVGPAATWGEGVGIRATLLSACGTSCHSTPGGALKAPFYLGSNSYSGSFTYSASVAKDQQITGRTVYGLTYYKPGDTFSAGSMTSGSAWRCDYVGSAPGCVYSDPRRVVVDSDKGQSKMASLPGIVDSIRGVQRAGLHIGKPGSSIPLTRATEAQKNANRNAVCGPNVKPGPGDIWWKVNPKDKGTQPSCDEYPFASTTQGGTAYAPPNRAIKWVPLSENNAQGAILKNFYDAYHILPGDNFYVNVGA
ncbi:NucA/NucB deoxyribonuclease domain-containing protein [Streptomyces orinoci]|uniref:NucA/NucB deoxyribonuclease domain-containing protein n=1 Tax=Streptomyces orinoci TaxID=67339 RepID=A0ABV3JQE2_STRON|nr:NucA/NucB deoxyribonuclease domain-containing protein [Streptomyces orinoci]